MRKLFVLVTFHLGDLGMPNANFAVQENSIAKLISSDGIPIREDILFTNPKGEEKGRIRKRNEKLLRKLRPALQRVLLPDEAVFYMANAKSPLNILEQVTAAWWTALLAASTVVITNKRILFFPVNMNGSWKESARSTQWGDIAEIKAKGMLVRNVVFKYRNGKKEVYTNFKREDAKKISTIAAVLLQAGAGEQSPEQGPVHMCPDCRNPLIQQVYSCSNCGLSFKNETSMILRSIFLPGGGYFYTGHPMIALLPAILEGLLLIEIFFILVGGLTGPNAKSDLLATALFLGLFWGFETAVTILHCRRYIREFIPEKRKSETVQTLSAKAGN